MLLQAGRHKRSVARRIAVLLLCAIALLSSSLVRGAPTLDAVSDTLGVGPSTSDGISTFEPTGLSARITGLVPGSDVLVLASFNSKTRLGESGTRNARFQLQDDDGAGASREIFRRLSGTSDQGVVTATHIFEDVSGDRTFQLYHRTKVANSASVDTYNGSLVAIPLVTDGGTHLNWALASQDLDPAPDPENPFDSSTTVGTYSDVEKNAGTSLSATVTVPEGGGDIFIASSFNSRSAGVGTQVGGWRLVINGGGLAADTLVGLVTNRAMPDGNGDDGAMTLYGLEEGLAEGTYTVGLQQALISGGGTLTTRNSTLAALALTIPGSDGDYFPAFTATNPGATTNNTTAFANGASKAGFRMHANSKMFLAGSFYAESNTGPLAYGEFQLNVSDSSATSVYSSTSGLERYLSGSNDSGSGGIVGLTGRLDGGGYDPSLQFRPTAGSETLEINNPVLVGFGLSSALGLSLYRAYIHVWERESGRRVTVLDTCRARSTNEAHAIFNSRHPGARIVSVLYIRDLEARGYRLFAGGIRTADGRNIRDTCYALNPSQARRILGGRSPDGGVNHIGLYPVNRLPVTYYAVTYRPDFFDTMDASDLKSAFQSFSQRYPQERIVSVKQVSHRNEYHIYEGILDPREVIEMVRARSAEDASAMALGKHARHRVLHVGSTRSLNGVATYEGGFHTTSGRVVQDNCSARSVSEAQKILRARHGNGSSPAVAELDLSKGYRLFKAGVTIKGRQRIVDATFARTAAEASRVLRGRYPTGTVSGAAAISDIGVYREYQGTINTGDSRTLVDTCWATSPAVARKVLSGRFMEGEIRALSSYGDNQPTEFRVVLKGSARRARCEARNKAEAYRLLANRFPDARVVTIRPVKDVLETTVFRATLNTADHRTVVDTVKAGNASAARQAFLEHYPNSRFTSLTRLTSGPVNEAYECRIDLPPAKDTCQANSPGEARQYYRARYPRSSTGALRTILN